MLQLQAFGGRDETVSYLRVKSPKLSFQWRE